MPAQSKAQQRFMGMVHATQKGDMENPSPEVEKAADSMSDKDAKDFASTKHDGLPEKIKEMIRQMVRETMTNSMIDEMNTSDAAGDYNTPYAFSGKDSEAKKGKKQADLTGYTVVKEAFIPSVGNIDDFKLKSLLLKNPKVKQILGNDEWKFLSDDKTDVIMVSGKPFNTIATDGKLEFELDLKAQKLVKPLGKARPKITSYYSNLNENRWRDIKNEEAPATTKVNKGIANINHQLAEIEKFLGWYGKLKAENGVNNGNFWKRTNNHIYTIKERLLNLERQVRKISE